MAEKTEKDHLTKKEVLDVFEGRATYSDLVTDNLAHLSATCKTCQQTLCLPIADRFGWVKDESANNDLVATLLVALKAGPEGLERWAKREVDELLAVEGAERRELLESDPDRFRAPFVVDELLERCEDQLTRDAARALELAELAVDVSLRVDPEAFRSLAWHGRARAAAHRANCMRVNNQRPGADEVFHHAYKLYRRAEVPDVEVEAEIAYLEASLAIDQRHFRKADSLLSKSLAVYHRIDDSRFFALTLLKRAHAAYQRGQPTDALDDLQKAIAYFESTNDRRFCAMACFNLVLYAVEAGDLPLAHRHYHQHSELLEFRTEPWFTLRLQWLQAKMAHLEGKPHAAQKLYTLACEGFLLEGLGYDAALVSLELASLQLEQGDTRAVRRLAGEMAPIFEAQDVHREALAALALFHHAAQAEEVTVELVTDLRRYLQLARRDPSFKFERA